MNVDFARHRLVVEADAHPNVLLRLLEPFSVNDVLPTRVRLDAPAASHRDPAAPGAMRMEIEFGASAEIADRLCARIEAMVPVRGARLVSFARVEAAA